MTNIPIVQVNEVVDTPQTTLDLDGMSSEQKVVAEEMTKQAEQVALYSVLSDLSAAINSLGKLAGSISSDEFDVEYDAANGRIMINPKNDGSAIDDTDANSDVDGGDGLPDPQDYEEYSGAYVRKVTLNATTLEWEVLDDSGVAITTIDIISVADEDNSSGDRMAWVNSTDEDSGLPDPQDYAEYTGAYVRAVTLNATTLEWEVLDDSGVAISTINIISVADEDNSSGDRMAWVNDYMRFVDYDEA